MPAIPEIKIFLNNIQIANAAIDSNLLLLEDYRRNAESVSSLHNSAENTEALLKKIYDKECELNSEIDSYVDLKIKVQEYLNNIPEGEVRRALINHYVNLMTWENTAELMHYSLRSIHYLHQRGLEILTRFEIP
ncbi:MAG: hypothetical protein ACI4J1_00345 [Ruminiclostridium sp.]